MPLVHSHTIGGSGNWLRGAVAFLFVWGLGQFIGPLSPLLLLASGAMLPCCAVLTRTSVLYARATRTSRLHGVRTRGAGQLALRRHALRVRVPASRTARTVAPHRWWVTVVLIALLAFPYLVPEASLYSPAFCRFSLSMAGWLKGGSTLWITDEERSACPALAPDLAPAPALPFPLSLTLTLTLALALALAPTRSRCSERCLRTNRAAAASWSASSTSYYYCC